MKEFWNLIKSNIVQWLALVLSVINLSLYLREKRKEKLRLTIVQKGSAYNFDFLYKGRRQYAFCYIEIINQSKTETSITKVEIIDTNGSLIQAGYFGEHTNPLDSEMELFFVNRDMSEGRAFKVDSDNLFENDCLKGYGKIEGYLFFEGISPLIEDHHNYTILLETPLKTFRSRVMLYRLPKELASFYEVDSALRSKR